MVVPQGWTTSKMSEITILMTNGFVGSIKDEYVMPNDGVLYIQGFNVEENSFNLTGIKYVSESFHRQHSKSELRNGDMLTVQTGDIGVCTVIPKEYEGANCHALIISRFNKLQDSRFFSYYFNSIGRKSLTDIGIGSTMLHINVGHMLNVEVPVPPLPEQRRIADALSDTDALISALEKLIDKKRAIKQGAMQELLTGNRRLDGFIGEWVEKKFDEIFYLVTDFVANGSFETIRGNVAYLDTVGYAVLIRTADYNNGFTGNFIYIDEHAYNFLGKSKLTPGDIIISNVGAVGTVFKAPDLGKPISLAPNAITVKTKEDNDFVYHMLQSEIGQSAILEITSFTAQPKFNKTDFKKAKLTIPPTLEEQTAIASILSDMDAEIDALNTKLDKLRNIKQGMMSELLTGRIRLLEEV